MPPRQKTTFNKKGKGTTTYKEYNPAQERASSRLERFIRDNPAGDNRNTQQSTVQQVVTDMPTKFQGKFKGVNNYDNMNSAQKMIFDFYNNRNKYQRDMNNLRTSSPEMRQAYAQRFPVENFAMQAGPMAFGAMTGIPVAALQAGFDNTRKGAGLGLDSLKKAGEFLKKGIDVGASAIDKGMNFAKDRIYDVEDALYYNTPIKDLPETKDKIVDTFQDAIAKREDDNIFSPQNVPGPGGGVDFREGFDSFLTDVPQQEVEKLDPLANQKLFEGTGDYFDTRKGFGTRMPGVPIIGDGAFNTMNQVDPNNQFDVAELTQKQIDFMRDPMQSLDFQSRDSLFNKVKQLEDKGFLGFGAQEPTTREEFEQFINSGGIQQAANGGMMEKGIASLNSPEYQRLMGASNFGF